MNKKDRNKLAKTIVKTYGVLTLLRRKIITESTAIENIEELIEEAEKIL